MMDWYPVYLREMLIMQRKIGKLGYIFSTVISPFIYLTAFGMGLSGRVSLPDGEAYLPFLTSGIVGMTVIMNAFYQTALSISGGRLYHQTFQSLMLSPISACNVVTGIVLAGVTRAAFFGTLILAVAFGIFQVVLPNWAHLFGGILAGAFFFSSLGAVVGLYVKQPDDVSFINNLLITPMIFFGGAFFPITQLPEVLKKMAALSPIGAVNSVLRSGSWNNEVLWSLSFLVLLTIGFFYWSVYLCEHYSE